MPASISKNFKNIEVTMDRDTMLNRFDTMMSNVESMIQQQPTYSVWIKFQMGLSDPIIFDTSSTDKKSNLIAQLTYEKVGAGAANQFTLTVYYDPFNSGQEPSNQLEALDELIAKCMSEDLGDDLSNLRGYLQYGYNTTNGTDLISPKYRVLIMGMNSDTKQTTGIITYTFTGYSELASDCDFQVSVEAVSEPKNKMEIICNTLYKYYGDESNPPKHVDNSIKVQAGSPGYAIDIPEKLFTDADEITVEEISSKSPWEYCEIILKQYPLSKVDADSGVYDNVAENKSAEQPRYMMYITDGDPKTIHIDYVSPKESSNLKINKEITWSEQTSNLVVEWNPQVDLFMYVTNKMLRLRQQKMNALEVKQTDLAQELTEFYDAELTLVGIPAEIPLSAEIRVKPRILQSISRTAGVYVTNGAVDTISTQGTYTTLLKLIRIRNLEDSTQNIVANNTSKSETAVAQKATDTATATDLKLSDAYRRATPQELRTQGVDMSNRPYYQQLFPSMGGR